MWSADRIARGPRAPDTATHTCGAKIRCRWRHPPLVLFHRGGPVATSAAWPPRYRCEDSTLEISRANASTTRNGVESGCIPQRRRPGLTAADCAATHGVHGAGPLRFVDSISSELLERKRSNQ